MAPTPVPRPTASKRWPPTWGRPSRPGCSSARTTTTPSPAPRATRTSSWSASSTFSTCWRSRRRRSRLRRSRLRNRVPMAKDSPEAISKPVERVLALAENAVYTLVGVLLVAGALAALVVTGYHLVEQIDDGALHAVEVALDGLLFVFILLELLAGLRATIVERQLVAEPFLMVGIIASIKEIVITALQAKEARGKPGEVFEDAM